MMAIKQNKWFSVTENHDNEYIDFSVNTNFLGLPERVIQDMEEMAPMTEYYPDPECKKLRQQLSYKYHVNTEKILCGNSADDLLYRLIFSLKPKRALIMVPTFEEYEKVLNLVGCDVIHY